MSSSTHFDVLIVGGGLAGASLACALGGSRFSVGLLERQPPVLAEGWDTRIYAISPANVAFLERCGAWASLPPERVVPIEKMDVRGDAGGRLGISAYECGLQALAWSVESSRMADGLWQAARRQPGIHMLCPATPVEMNLEGETARVLLDDGRQLAASLVVAADGANSWVRERAGIVTEMRSYGEWGVVANFNCEKPHFGTAFQWFRPDGVLAYLPLPGNRISIVWSTPESHAQDLLALAPDAFNVKLAEAAGMQLGALELITAPAGFPLRWMRTQTLVAPHLALIGDAAHAVHPLSGQGINLGFQDAQALADVLLALPPGVACGDVDALQSYARARAGDISLVRGGTDALQQLFVSDFAPLSFVRNAGLSLVGAIPPLRNALARYAAGLF